MTSLLFAELISRAGMRLSSGSQISVSTLILSDYLEVVADDGIEPPIRPWMSLIALDQSEAHWTVVRVTTLIERRPLLSNANHSMRGVRLKCQSTQFRNTNSS